MSRCRTRCSPALVASLAGAIVCCSAGDPGVSTVRGRGGAGSAPEDPGASAPADAAADARGDAATSVEYEGEATYYNADGTGACGLPASPGDLNVAALNGEQYAKSWCGKCALVTGPKGTVKVRIVDLCPGCARGDLDLSKQAFAVLAALSDGRVKIRWHTVAC